MGRHAKIDEKTKLQSVDDYKTGRLSINEIANTLAVHKTSVRQWIRNYEAIGENAFHNKHRNRSYSKDFKAEVIQAYLEGNGSYLDLAKKYQITSYEVVRNWISKYNRHNEIKAYDPKGYVYMAKTRKVSYEEKLEIIKWTIEHDSEYKLAAEKFETSYAQVYNWVKKYKAQSEKGLQDNRGIRKREENLTEVEKLKREVELLRRKNERLEMEAEVIKKFQEIERRDILAKSAKKPNIKR